MVLISRAFPSVAGKTDRVLVLAAPGHVLRSAANPAVMVRRLRNEGRDSFESRLSQPFLKALQTGTDTQVRAPRCRGIASPMDDADLAPRSEDAKGLSEKRQLFIRAEDVVEHTIADGLRRANLCLSSITSCRTVRAFRRPSVSAFRTVAWVIVRSISMA